MPNEKRAIEKYARHAVTWGSGQDRPSPLRRAAVARLALAPGNTVLDVGCGNGLSIQALEDAIGPEGRIIGIDLSPDMLARARERIARRDWRNVTLVQASAADAAIPVQADAALFHLTHDIMRSPRAVANAMHHLKTGGRVVAVGISWAPWWRFLVNFRVWRLARGYTTTFEGLRAPWSHLAELVPDLSVESIGDGGMYLASGTKRIESAGGREPGV